MYFLIREFLLHLNIIGMLLPEMVIHDIYHFPKILYLKKTSKAFLFDASDEGLGFQKTHGIIKKTKTHFYDCPSGH